MIQGEDPGPSYIKPVFCIVPFIDVHSMTRILDTMLVHLQIELITQLRQIWHEGVCFALSSIFAL